MSIKNQSQKRELMLQRNGIDRAFPPCHNRPLFLVFLLRLGLLPCDAINALGHATFLLVVVAHVNNPIADFATEILVNVLEAAVVLKRPVAEAADDDAVVVIVQYVGGSGVEAELGRSSRLHLGHICIDYAIDSIEDIGERVELVVEGVFDVVAHVVDVDGHFVVLLRVDDAYSHG